MKKRLITGLVFVLVIVLGLVLKFYVSNYFFDALILAVSVIAGFEASRIFAKMGRYNNKIMAMVFPCLAMLTALLGIAFDKQIGIIYTLLMIIALMLLCLILTFIIEISSKNITILEMKNMGYEGKRAKFCLKKSFNTTLTFIYPTFLLLFLTFINHFENLTTSFSGVNEFNGRLSLFILIFTILIPVISDTFAYITGSIIGGKKLAPKISPNKTISGAVGGIIWCVLLSITLFCIFNAFPVYSQVFTTINLSVWQIAIMAFIGSIVSQLGDLFESFLKRSAKVKDSGKILPGHGGMLDRFDSHIAVAPLMFIAFSVILALL